jgi:hypothetical protein
MNPEANRFPLILKIGSEAVGLGCLSGGVKAIDNPKGYLDSSAEQDKNQGTQKRDGDVVKA